MNSPAGAWNKFWFEPSHATNLGVCRVVAFAVILWNYGARDVSAWSDVDAVFWVPMWFFALFKIPPASATTIVVLQLVWKCALVTSCVGLLTRFSTLLAWVLGIYLLGLLNCYGKMGHGSQMIVMILGIMAVSRCGDAFSLDILWRRSSERDDNSLTHAAYTWPIRLMQVIFVLIFFAAGVAKLRESGLAWISGENIANVLVKAHYGTEAVWNPLGLYVAGALWLCWMVAAMTIVLELSSPLALFSRWARAIVIPGLLGMQLGILVLMGTDFSIYLAGYAFWVPWAALLNRWRQPPDDAAPAGSVRVEYDGRDT